MTRPTDRIGPGAEPQLMSGPNPPGTEELAKAIAEENYWDWSAEDVRRGCRRLARKYLAAITPLLALEVKERLLSELITNAELHQIAGRARAATSSPGGFIEIGPIAAEEAPALSEPKEGIK